jgi:hypothetical protein
VGLPQPSLNNRYYSETTRIYEIRVHLDESETCKTRSSRIPRPKINCEALSSDDNRKHIYESVKVHSSCMTANSKLNKLKPTSGQSSSPTIHMNIRPHAANKVSNLASNVLALGRASISTLRQSPPAGLPLLDHPS